MSLFTALINGHSGLTAASRGIDATSHNIANALTPGYHRRSVEQSVNDPVRRSGLWLGTGVGVDSMVRSADTLLGTQIVAQTGVSSAASTLQQNLTVIESWFDETSATGARISLSQFFDSLNQATSNPADTGLRSAVLESAGALASNISTTQQALAEAADLYDSRLANSVSSVNTQLQEIARLNSAIVEGGGALGNGDLADQRDLLLESVATTAGTTVHFESDGSATVFVGGHAVVSGEEARALTIDNPLGGSPSIHVQADGGRVPVNDSVGGNIAGHLAARTVVDGYRADLNTFASTFADTLNTQHSAGFDRTGGAGVNLFTYDPADAAASLSLNSALVGQPDLLAFAGDPAALAGDGVNLEAMINIETQTMFGSATAADQLSSVTSRVGSDIAGALATADREGAVLADLNELNQNLHGVDLDEEATNLMMYQTAYQAAAKVMTVSDQLTGTLLGLVQ